MAKIELDKYYTPKYLAEYCVNKTKEIIGEENITEWLEPSAGSGNFLDYLGDNYLAYDIAPEDDRIIKRDYLELDLEYKKGRCTIGNPPFGDRKNNLVKKFLEISVKFSDYICFILPIRQYKNSMSFYKFNLIYSEDLGVLKYSDVPIHCCFNIYKRPKNGLNHSKPNYNLKNVEILEHHRTNNPLLKDVFDYRICSFGASIGKKCTPNTYCKELCFIINKTYKERVIKLLEETNFKKEFPSVSTPYIASWQVYKYIKEQIPEIQ